MSRPTVLRIIAYLVLFICFTLLFLVFNYPSQRLTQQANDWVGSISGGVLVLDGVRISPPITLTADNVILVPGEAGPVDLGRVVMKPHLLGLLSGKKGADIHLANPWLEADMSLVQSGGGWDVTVPSAAVDLSRLPDDALTLPVSLQGEVTVSLNIVSDGPSRGISEGDVKISSGSVEVGGVLLQTLGFSPLRINRILAVATLKDNVMTLGETTMEGDVNAVVRGSIRLVPADPMNSRLDLNVDLSPSAASRERLTPVLTLMGARTRADGSTTMRVRGTLGRPSVTM